MQMRRSSVLGVEGDEAERSAKHVSYVLDDMVCSCNMSLRN